MEDEKKYVLFRVFRNEDDMKFFTDVFDDCGIDYTIENPRADSNDVLASAYGVQMAEDAMQYKFMLMIAEDDFERSQNELRSHIAEYFRNAGSEENTLLNEFNDEELLDVIKKPDEWAVEDIVMAQTLLDKRGKHVSDEVVEAYRNKRLEEVRQPKFGGYGTIIIGYIFAILGGVIGIFLAASLLGKKRIFNGEKVNIYDKATRTNAIIYLTISILVIIVITTYFVVKS
ncbi:MAG: hypothetical protein J5709_09160 [Bacteroidales bacterium]|nr:hypothetical protein [Bacteroidales bacterium]